MSDKSPNAFTTDTLIFTSQLLGRQIYDEESQQKIGKLFDFLANQISPYPEITHLIIKKDNKLIYFPMSNVELSSLIFSGQIILKKSNPTNQIDNNLSFRVKELLYDKQIVDLHGAKVERVNDVHLLVSISSKKVWLVHADVGFTGLLRRLGFEKILTKVFRKMKYPLKDELISWKVIELFASQKKNLTLSVSEELIKKLHPGDIADILEELDKDKSKQLIQTLDFETAASVLEQTDEDVQKRVIESLSPEIAADIIDEMEPSEAADILSTISRESSQKIMREVEDADELMHLIHYPQDTVGAYMTTDFITAKPSNTVSETIENIRKQLLDITAFHYIYILENGKIKGVVSIRNLLVSEKNTKIEDIMTTRVVTLNAMDNLDSLSKAFEKYCFIYIPIVDDEDKIIGVVFFRDSFEVLLPYYKKLTQ